METKSKIRELLHIPEVLHGGNTVFTHLVQELEDTVSIYLRKTVEKHNVTKNYEVHFSLTDLYFINFFSWSFQMEESWLLIIARTLC